MKKRMQKTTHPGALHCFKCASCSKIATSCFLFFFSPHKLTSLFFLQNYSKTFVFQSLEQTPLEFNFSSRKALQICKICGRDVLFPSPSSSFFSPAVAHMWLVWTTSEVVWVVLVFLFFLLSVFCDSSSLPQCAAACFHTHSVFLLPSELTQAKC